MLFTATNASPEPLNGTAPISALLSKGVKCQDEWLACLYKWSCSSPSLGIFVISGSKNRLIQPWLTSCHLIWHRNIFYRFFVIQRYIKHAHRTSRGPTIAKKKKYYRCSLLAPIRCARFDWLPRSRGFVYSCQVTRFRLKTMTAVNQTVRWQRFSHANNTQSVIKREP